MTDKGRDKVMDVLKCIRKNFVFYSDFDQEFW